MNYRSLQLLHIILLVNLIRLMILDSSHNLGIVNHYHKELQKHMIRFTISITQLELCTSDAILTMTLTENIN